MKKKNKSVFGTIVRILSVCLAVLAVLMTLMAVYQAVFVGKNNRSLFGIYGFTVLSDSMKATDFASGDIIFCKKTDVSTLQEGDIISFVNQDPTDEERFGQVITHKIRKSKSADGQYVFVTYGTTTGVDDTWQVPGSAVMGKYLFHIPRLGEMFQYLKTTPGYVLCVLLPFMLLIGLQATNSIRLFKKYKKEQTEAIRAEQEQLDKEREEFRRVMEELKRMKTEMQEKNGEPQSAAAPATEIPAATETPSANTEKTEP